jgi:hypothetical protein
MTISAASLKVLSGFKELQGNKITREDYLPCIVGK